jgi:LuxR family maltose regulon positive regulatory protein
MQMSARWGWQAMPAVGMAHIYLGQVLYEQNDLVKATQALTDGIGQLRGSTEQYFLARGYVTLSQIQLARGEPESALATIQQGEDWFTQLQVADLGGQTLLALGKARLWLEQGQLASVVHWFETCQWRAEATNAGYLQRLTLARLRLAQSRLGQPELFLLQTTEMLNQLLALKEREGWWGQVIELLLLQALVGQLQGNYAGALTILERALRLAEPEGYVRLFVDEGEPMAALLRQARQRGLFLNYVDNLLAAFPTDESKQRPADLLPEPLSERELEVLRLVATGVSNQDIAGQLFIALSTVKKHVGNILVKLDTPNRVQAITRARDLGLLS